jgi:hypothetical protein
MNFDTVLAFGDSHVAGMETIDGLVHLPGSSCSGITESDHRTKEFSFPNLVAKYYNIPCYNYSMSGGSNARSLRVLTSVIQQHPNSLVLFGYTSAGRTEFYIPGKDKFLFRDGDFVQFAPGLLGTEWDEQQALYQTYFKQLYHPRNTLAEYMFCVDAICQAHAATYLHIPLFPEFATADVSPLIKNILTFETTSNYLDWCIEKKFALKKYGHYGKDAHVATSELIIQSLTDILK